MSYSLVTSTLLALGTAALLIGCGGDKEAYAPAEYEVKATNLTNFQPFSPLGLSLYSDAGFFEVGEKASLALEKLAEGGDNSGLLSKGKTSVSAQGPILPGETAVLNITKEIGLYKLSAFTMLVNTNDAFTGLNGYALDDLKVGETVVFNTNAYDAGTEANSEAAGTIPGPADGGEGFNPARDDVDVVRMHAGVLTKDEGLSSSVLSAQAKFDNPVMRLSIRRIR